MQLPVIKRQSQRTISVDKMYKRQPCSTHVSGKLQRVHAIDPDESDNGKCQQSENSSFNRFTKRWASVFLVFTDQLFMFPFKL
jgi:ubiquitin-like-specific protease 1C/D